MICLTVSVLYDNTLSYFAVRSTISAALTVFRATEIDITMIGLQNAGKTTLLRVLAVRNLLYLNIYASGS